MGKTKHTSSYESNVMETKLIYRFQIIRLIVTGTLSRCDLQSFIHQIFLQYIVK